jgi:hypothetical protein
MRFTDFVIKALECWLVAVDMFDFTSTTTDQFPSFQKSWPLQHRVALKRF